MGVIRQAELPQRQLEIRFLGVVRIETDGHQNEVRQVWCALAEVEDVVVPGHVGLEAQVRLQCRVLPSDAVELGDLGDDVARCVVVADANLVLLRVQILFLARNRRRLA
jgi:hypothetical protein